MTFSSVEPFVRFAGKIWYGGQASVSLAYDARLFFIVSGKATLFLKDEQNEVGPMDAVYIPPAFPYRLSPKEKIELFAFNFDFTQNHSAQKETLSPASREHFVPSRVSEQPLSAFACPLLKKNISEALPVAEKLLKECKANRPFGEDMSSLLLKELLILVYRSALSRDAKERDFAQIVSDYVSAHCAEPLTNEDIARHFSYHPYYLNRVFKVQTGETIHTFLLKERVQKSLTFLMNGEPLDSIAEKCGFPNQAHFTQVFKKMMGVTPSAYRKDHFI
ncbi:MAG: AraC family transcriptional regulator [Clostridia bacterium]|nr:AraC family transcriptional regulator [Clostridia bacterium]